MTEPYSTKEELDALTKPHPAYQEIIDEHAQGKYVPGQLDWKDPNVIKYVIGLRKAALDSSYGPTPSGVKESEVYIKMRDGHESLTLIFAPEQKPAEGSPLIQLNYGGGFTMGEARQLGGYARALVKLYGAVVACITYRLGPEHKWPVGHYDAWDSFIWLGQHAADLGADPSRGFIVGGVSAGGNLSLVIAQNAVEQNISPPITGLWLCVPKVFPTVQDVPEEYRHLLVSETTPAIADGPILGANVLAGFGHHYRPDPTSKWYAPHNADKPFIGLPPSYVEVDGLDPLRDDGLIYEKVVRKNGTKTRLTVWPGLPHAHFATMQVLGALPLRQQASRDTMKGIAWLLGQSEPSDEVIDKHVELPDSG